MRAIAVILALFPAVPAFADDGELFRRNVSKTPDLETDHATIQMLKQYVSGQVSAVGGLPHEPALCLLIRKSN